MGGTSWELGRVLGRGVRSVKANTEEEAAADPAGYTGAGKHQHGHSSAGKDKLGAGELAQRLGARPALPGVLSSIPSNLMLAHNHL